MLEGLRNKIEKEHEVNMGLLREALTYAENLRDNDSERGFYTLADKDDNQQYVQIFTDGSQMQCRGIKRFYGAGIFFHEHSQLNDALPIPGCGSTAEAELFAASVAVAKVTNIKPPVTHVQIFIDNLAAVGWIQSIFRATDLDLTYLDVSTDKSKFTVNTLKKLRKSIKKLVNLKVTHVKSHTGQPDRISLGNEAADKLAKEGARIHLESAADTSLR